ncbi:hypothetical protein Q9L58_002563 [Maublancomyces gigas]|uniref:Uncharacterized protein n=1 Tax=Discina gigas TaxID=1032678 RepID=A0ABR3GR80_9PEZI
MNQVICACGYSSATSPGDYHTDNSLLSDRINLDRMAILKTPSEQCPMCEMALSTTHAETQDPLAEGDRTAVVKMDEVRGPPAVGITGESGPRGRVVGFAGKDALRTRPSVETGRSRAEFKKKIMIACARAAAGKRVAPITGTMCSRTNASEVRAEDVVSARV